MIAKHNAYSIMYYSQNIQQLLDSSFKTNPTKISNEIKYKMEFYPYNLIKPIQINPKEKIGSFVYDSSLYSKNEKDIIKSVVSYICNEAIKNANRNVHWKSNELEKVQYTYSSDEYDRKMVCIDKRLLSLPKHIRADGNMDYETWVNYCKFSNKNQKNQNQTVYSFPSLKRTRSMNFGSIK